MFLRYPRMKIRGPIEAFSSLITTRFVPPYPRMKIRGPIEARANDDEDHGDPTYPRMKIRGPIEAVHSQRDSGHPQGIRG